MVSKKNGIWEKVDEIRTYLELARKSDLYRLKRRFNQLNKSSKSKPQDWLALEREIAASIHCKQERQNNIPKCHFDSSLPINQHAEVISTAFIENQVVVICGETGSGKTTQLPKLCLEIGRGVEGVIGHTQPRRLAAKTVAKRIADELDSEIGTYVGYKIRHQDKTGDHAYLKVMTDGILLAELQQDRYLNQYDTLIIDEAHERSLNIDFILGYLKQLLPKRPDLKVIVTSATIDVNRFSEHFNNAPVIEVSGRSYPVDVLYRPIEDEGEESLEREQHILNAIRELSSFDMGDILIFMEGEGEIHETDKFLRKQKLPDTDILPLYARLSSSRQNKIFSPHKRRHIVLATNVAETSLTIPGIRYVIDAGLARFSRYSYRSKVQRLPIEKISKAAANQRKGRCGRTSDGICIRLYSEEDFLSRQEFTQAEILRTNLASVILQMKTLNLGDINDYPFIESPDSKFINDGLRLLREINALDKQDQLTPTGKKLARLPLDPRYARILIAADSFNCLNEMLIIISALSIQDPRERPVDNAQKADQAHQQFNHDDSDFLWFIKLWDFYHKQIKKLSQNKLRKLCQQNFLSYMRMREWQDIHRQLRHVCTDMGLTINSEAANYQNIHCAILTGMPSHIAFLSDKHEYTGARNIKLNIFPASGQFHKKPKWIVAAELVETSRLYARNVARIESQWVISTAKHLLRHNYSDARWESESARVIALETISLFGMTLLAGKKVNYGRINPLEAKALFVRHALVGCDLESSASFYKQNCQLINEVKKLEIKSRRPDILDEESIYSFYMQVLPDDVYDGQLFAAWVKTLSKEQKQGLCLNKDSIMTRQADDVTETRFPEAFKVQNISLPIEYKFTPGDIDDGLSIDLPLEILNQFDEVQMDYLVPGMLEEKIMVLLKSLPKQIRKALVPVPETAKECAINIKDHKISLKKNLESYLFRTRSIEIKKEDWAEIVIPDHLRVNYRIIDQENVVLDHGKDLNQLKQKFASQTELAFNQVLNEVMDVGEIVEWNFGDLPKSQEIKINEKVITIYPSLIAEEGKVYKHAFDNFETAEQYLKYGLRALFKKAIPKEIKCLQKNLTAHKKLALLYSNIGTQDELVGAIVNVAIDETFLFEKELIRQQDRFLAMVEYGKARLLLNGENICTLLEKVLHKYRKVVSRLSDSDVIINKDTVNDIEEQLEYLVFNGFVDSIPLEYLGQYPRYFESILKRLEKLRFDLNKDSNNILLLNEHWCRIKKLIDNAYETDGFTPLLNEYRWMLEELRISLFTQELRTRFPVSIKRMNKIWEALQKTH